MSNNHIDLKTRAHQAVTEAGFQPDFGLDIIKEIQALPPQPPAAGARDLRSLLWSSIDNDDSRDLDQIEYVESLPGGGARLLVGVADVSWAVPMNSAIDRRAANNTTSVYTGVATFPMLPEELSTDATSLGAAQDRLAVVIELKIQPDGQVADHQIYPALVRNQGKLAYSSAGAWLEGKGPMPQAVPAAPGLEAQLRLQADVAKKLQEDRKRRGTLIFADREVIPKMQDGQVKELNFPLRNIATDIIENFMIAANVAMAEHLKRNHSLSIRRVVRTPKRWDRIRTIAEQFGEKLPVDPNPKALSEFLARRLQADPNGFGDLSLCVVKLLGPGEYVVEHPGAEQTGHFGLAANDYTHSTAPNRRYADLTTQRLLKAVCAGRPAPYSEGELSAIAARCTERGDAERKVERLMHKIAAASLMSHQIGIVFDAIVTGATPKGTFVRLKKFPAEGMVVRGAQGIDVGDSVKVKLLYVDVGKGFIDFERLK